MRNTTTTAETAQHSAANTAKKTRALPHAPLRNAATPQPRKKPASTYETRCSFE